MKLALGTGANAPGDAVMIAPQSENSLVWQEYQDSNLHFTIAATRDWTSAAPNEAGLSRCRYPIP